MTLSFKCYIIILFDDLRTFGNLILIKKQEVLTVAFVNAYLTDEEKKAFDEAKIPDPRWGLPKYILNARQWTVDRERGIALINCGVADRENYEIETFAFIDTQIEKRQILSFEITHYYLDDKKEEELIKKYNVNLIKNWKVLSVNHLYNSNIVNSYNEFLKLLSEALTTYGIDGDPKFIPNVKVFVTENK